MLRKAHSHFPPAGGQPTPEVLLTMTCDWAEDFIKAGVPGVLLPKLYDIACEDKTSFMPTFREIVAAWKVWKERFLPDYAPTWHVLEGLRTVEEDQRMIYGETIAERIERLVSPNPSPRPSRPAIEGATYPGILALGPVDEAPVDEDRKAALLRQLTEPSGQANSNGRLEPLAAIVPSTSVSRTAPLPPSPLRLIAEACGLNYESFTAPQIVEWRRFAKWAEANWPDTLTASNFLSAFQAWKEVPSEGTQ